jgi:CBS domain-containing protein
MTPFPWHVEIDEPLERAVELMQEHRIRHLPVTEGGELIGVIRARDVAPFEAAMAEGGGNGDLRVRDVSILDAYVVDLSEPLDRVLAELAARHSDSALIVRQGRLAGIFTASDACRHFALFLQMIFRGDDDDAA